MGNFWSKRHHDHHQPLHQSSPSSSNPPTPPRPQFPSPPRASIHPPPPLSPPVVQHPQPLPHPTTSEPPSFPSPQPSPRPVVQYPQPRPYPTTSQPISFPGALLPHNYGYNNNCNYSNYYYRPPVHPAGQYSGYRPYYNVNNNPQFSGFGVGPSFAPVPPTNPAPYVDHKNAKRIKNDVNVHKDTIRLQLDEQNPDCHLVSFTFDALVDGNITIFYFAKEGSHCTFSPTYPDIKPVKLPFQKGVGQKFCQPSGTGLDLGFFDTDDLSKPAPGEDVYPLVISVESFEPSAAVDHSNGEPLPHAQITQAVLEKKDSGNFHVKVMKQILWIDGVRYELREIFGISSSDETAFSDLDSGKECVICMSEVKNTAVLPCRHMCMCSECAKELRLQSDKCPVCRQPIEELLEIKVDEEGAG